MAHLWKHIFKCTECIAMKDSKMLSLSRQNAFHCSILLPKLRGYRLSLGDVWIYHPLSLWRYLHPCIYMRGYGWMGQLRPFTGFDYEWPLHEPPLKYVIYCASLRFFLRGGGHHEVNGVSWCQWCQSLKICSSSAIISGYHITPSSALEHGGSNGWAQGNLLCVKTLFRTHRPV